MSNPTSVVTERRLGEFYQEILPYLGGSADAGFTPIGTIIPMIAEDAPANYLKCNGATYNKSDYPELAAHLLSMSYNTPYIVSGDDTKFKVPDLRGEFLRGISTNGHTGEGNGARVGEHQAGTEIPYNMLSANGARSNGFINSTGTSQQSRINASADKLVGSPDKIFQIVTTEGTLSSSQYECYKVRPTNTSVLLCIATKDIYLNPAMDYSTSEKVVGKWIDGKTLYQKTIVMTMPTTASKRDGAFWQGDTSEDVTSLNISQLVNLTAMSSYPAICNLIPYFGYATEAEATQYAKMNAIMCWCNKSTISIRRYTPSSVNSDAGADVYVTIQYTKTT